MRWSLADRSNSGLSPGEGLLSQPTVGIAVGLFVKQHGPFATSRINRLLQRFTHCTCIKLCRPSPLVSPIHSQPSGRTAAYYL